MKYSHTKKFVNAKLLALLLALNLALTQSVYAIGASPLRSVISAQPGQTVETSIRATNSSDYDIQVTFEKSDFIMTENEDLKFIQETEENNTSMQNWIEWDSNLPILKSGEEKEIAYRIKVPQDAKSGGYYGVIFVGSKNPDELQTDAAVGVGVTTSVAHLIIVEVDDGTESLKTKLELTEFSTEKEEGKPLNFKTKFYNAGNTHQAPSGTITVIDNNKNIAAELEVNKNKYNNLPNLPKTVLTPWENENSVPLNPGVYYAYYYGTQRNGEEMAAELKLEIRDDGSATILETNMGKKIDSSLIKKTSPENAEKNNQTNKTEPLNGGLIIVIVVALGSILMAFSAYKTYKIESAAKHPLLKLIGRKKTKTKSKKQKRKGKKFFIILLILVTSATSNFYSNSALAQDDVIIHIQADIDQGQYTDITADGCWKQVLGNWQWSGSSDATVDLLQPGDREDTGSGDPADGTDSDWGPVTGTAKYDTAGGAANGTEMFPSNTNAFAYGDCKFTITFFGYDDYAVELYGTTFEHTVVVDEIDDMRNYNQTTFDYLLNAGNSGYPYVANQGEHGFYIVAENIGNVELDTGAAAGVAYDTDLAYNALTCNTDRPCYHFIPTTPNTQDLYDETAGDFENKTLIIRTAAGADFSFPAGDYTMTLTINLNTAP